jgi:hypothetical protein
MAQPGDGPGLPRPTWDWALGALALFDLLQLPQRVKITAADVADAQRSGLARILSLQLILPITYMYEVAAHQLYLTERRGSAEGERYWVLVVNADGGGLALSETELDHKPPRVIEEPSVLKTRNRKYSYHLEPLTRDGSHGIVSNCTASRSLQENDLARLVISFSRNTVGYEML